MKKIILCAVVIFSFIFIPVSKAQEISPRFASASSVSKKILTIPKKYFEGGGVPTNFVINKNGTNAAYIVNRKGKDFVVFNGAAGKKYDAIDMLTFSPNGEKVFYRAKNKKPEAEFFVETTEGATKAKKVSGTIDALYTPGWGFPFLSDKPVYYTTSKKGVHALFIGSKKILYAHRAFFNRKHTKMAYLYNYAHDDGTKGHQVVVDGKAGKAYPSIYDYQFNDDGTVSYVAGDAKKVVLVRDGKEIVSNPDPYSDGSLWAKLSPDGENVIMRRQRQVNMSDNLPKDFDEYIILNTQKSPRYDGMYADSFGGEGILTFSADSKRAAYTVVKDGAVKVIIDDNASPPIESVSYIDILGFIFSENSKHFAFLGKSDVEASSLDGTIRYTNPIEIVVDGKVIQIIGIEGKDDVTGVYDLTFSPISNALLYTLTSMKDNTQRLFAGAKEIKDENRVMIQLAPFAFDDNGTHVGFGELRNNPRINTWEIWWRVDEIPQ